MLPCIDDSGPESQPLGLTTVPKASGNDKSRRPCFGVR